MASSRKPGIESLEILGDRIERTAERMLEQAGSTNRLPVKLLPGALDLIDEAATARGLFMEDYIRRAVLSFAAHDLGKPWGEVMEGETTVRGLDGRVTDRTRGYDYGAWIIRGLEVYDDGESG